MSFCRERKSFIKLALERRYALAEAHCKYNQSLYALALAIRLFVARHSSPSSPLLIAYPSATNSETTIPTLIDNPTFIQRKPSDSEGKESKEEDDNGDEDFSDEEGPLCEHFYDDVDAPLLSPGRNYQWDFFNLFDVSGLTQKTGVDIGRRSEGEIKASRTRNDAKLVPCESKNLRQNNADIDDGRELLEALKDVGDLFVKAYNSGKAVSRMLEANRIPLQSGFDDIKGGLYPF